ncbi:unnamed protein product, partial [Prorocentrum cordatum]
AQPPAAGGLAGAREAFQAARALSEQSRFREAEPLLRAALRAMGGAEQAAVPPQARAEVWAHLGIARQSLDDVSGAVDAYTAAVELDPSLHVCLANLATLHAFRDEKEQALGFIDRALALEPSSAVYVQIRHELLQGVRREELPPPPDAGDPGESNHYS